MPDQPRTPAPKGLVAAVGVGGVSLLGLAWPGPLSGMVLNSLSSLGVLAFFLRLRPRLPSRLLRAFLALGVWAVVATLGILIFENAWWLLLWVPLGEALAWLGLYQLLLWGDRPPRRSRPAAAAPSPVPASVGDSTGAPEDSEADYRLRDERGDADGAYAMGILLEQRGDREEAEAAYRRADERGHPLAAADLGRLLEERGDQAGAEAAYRRANDRWDLPSG